MKPAPSFRSLRAAVALPRTGPSSPPARARLRAAVQAAVQGTLLADLGALGLLALATLGFFWRVVTGQNWMPADGGDLVSFLYPTYRFAAAALNAGTWPLWNPHLYLGAPHVADIQAGFLYPPNLLLFLLRPDFPYTALQWLSIGHIWFAGAGMYLFLARGQRLRPPAALAATLAFMFSDGFITHFGNLNFNAVMSWLPWVFWAYTSGLQAWENRRPAVKTSEMICAQPGVPASRHAKRVQAPIAAAQVPPAKDLAVRNQAQRAAALAALAALWPAALAGALLAVATLAGHIQGTLFILLALACYTALAWGQGRVLEDSTASAGRRAVAALAYLATTIVVTALLSAPVLLPTLELAGYTARSAWNYTEAAGYSLAPAQWIGWLIPGFFGRGPQFHWGAWPRVEVGYLGILPLVLAGLALALRRDRRTWRWAGLALAAFILALGIYAIPHGWLTLLPGFNQLRAPARLVLVADFALAVMAAIGLDAVARPLSAAARPRLQRAWCALAYATGAVWAFAVPLSYLALLLVQAQDQAIVIRVSITLIAVMTFAGLLAASLFWLAAVRGAWARPATLAWAAAALILLDLASNGAYQDLGNQNPSRGFEQSRLAGFLAEQPGPFRIDTRTGIEGLWQPDTALLYDLYDVGGLVNPLQLADVQRYWEGLGSRSSRLYDLLNARYVIAKKDVQLDWAKFRLAFDADPNLNVYLNQAALPPAFLVSRVQTAGSHEDAWQAIHAPGFDPGASVVVEDGPPGLAGGGQGSAGELSVGTGRLALQTEADGPALLVISQAWYPGWQVRVDGAPQGEPLRADYAFQAVPVPSGAHRVELVFAPPLWRAGWILALIALVLLLMLGLLRARTDRLRPPAVEGNEHGD